MGRILTVNGRKGDGDNVTGDFNKIEVFDAGYEKRAKLEMQIAQQIGAKLVKAYSNRQWKVIVDIEGRMLIIGCDSVSNTKGYHIHMAGRTIHELQQRAVLAAGEILERHELARSKQFDADWFETLARDNTDSVMAADSKAEPI